MHFTSPFCFSELSLCRPRDRQSRETHRGYGPSSSTGWTQSPCGVAGRSGMRSSLRAILEPESKPPAPGTAPFLTMFLLETTHTSEGKPKGTRFLSFSFFPATTIHLHYRKSWAKAIHPAPREKVSHLAHWAGPSRLCLCHSSLGTLLTDFLAFFCVAIGITSYQGS